MSYIEETLYQNNCFSGCRFTVSLINWSGEPSIQVSCVHGYSFTAPINIKPQVSNTKEIKNFNDKKSFRKLML